MWMDNIKSHQWHADIFFGGGGVMCSMKIENVKTWVIRPTQQQVALRVTLNPAINSCFICFDLHALGGCSRWFSRTARSSEPVLSPNM